VEVLHGLDLALGRGETLALLGPSGSGKTTILSMIGGFVPPTEGRVRIGGVDVTDLPPARRPTATVFQDYALFPHMSVLENVMFGLRKLTRAEREPAARDMLERVGLADFAGDYPHTLSGGEQQRVALARALAPRPSLLLMDEPFSNLDRGTRDTVREATLAVIRKTGASAILVTHDPEDAMRSADRIALLQSGRVIQAGSPEDLYERPASLFVARFFSEFNEIEGTCSDGWVTTSVGPFRAAGLAEGTKAVVCLRAGDVRLAPDIGGGTKGRLLSQRFLGDSLLSSVEVKGLSRPLQVETAGGNRLPPGQSVQLEFAAERAFVFPASETPARRRPSGTDRQIR
jgi:iron(III) transport system ATP-binding protein